MKRTPHLSPQKKREMTARLLEIYGPGCAYCGAVGVAIVLDHAVPRCLGGANDETNLVPACETCNGAKGGRTPLLWLLGGLSRRRESVHARGVPLIDRVIAAATPAELPAIMAAYSRAVPG